MNEIETRSTSADSAEVSPIVLRPGEQIRLAFLPQIVNNPHQAEACVRGNFVYQRKRKKDQWETITGENLSSLKAGEGFRLELHTGELFQLFAQLRTLYALHGEHGVPRGRVRFLRLEAGLAEFLALGQEELANYLNAHPDHAAQGLLKLIRWLAASPSAAAETEKLSSLAPAELPAVGALFGLSAMKAALQYWTQNRINDSEDFWQNAISQRAYVLSQVFAYPIVIVREKAYVGGKRIDDRHGNVADFLAKIKSTDAVILIEIKTPATKLLGQEYRDEAYALSPDLSGAIAQVLRYRQSLMSNFRALLGDREPKLTLGEPRCVVIAGDGDRELTIQAKRENFELWRERTLGVTIITYDELFKRVGSLVEFLEASAL